MGRHFGIGFEGGFLNTQWEFLLLGSFLRLFLRNPHKRNLRMRETRSWH